MDLKHGTRLGYWNTPQGRLEVIAYMFGSAGTLHIFTPYGNGGAVRSRNFIKTTSNTGFEPVADLTETDINKFAASAENDLGGFLPPTGFVIPTGWGQVADSNGDKYIVPVQFIKNGVDSSAGSDTGLVAASSTYSALLSDPIGWVKANPIWAACIAVAVYLLFFQKKGRGRKKGFLSSIF
jgi:hypothetical protein